MKKPSEFESIEELEKGINKYDKKVARATKSMYFSTVVLGATLLLGLPIGLIAQMPLLTIISAITAGVSVVNQVGCFALGAAYNAKSMDLQREKETRKSDENSVNSNKTLSVETTKTVILNKTKSKRSSINKGVENDSDLDIEL